MLGGPLACSPFAHPVPHTCSAFSSAVGAYVGVDGVVGVSSGAVCDERPPGEVDEDADWFHVIGVDASFVAAEVVDCEPVWDGAVGEFVGDAVGSGCAE